MIVDNKLIVADTDNNRVLIYNSIPTSNDPHPDVVIGQVDFYHNLRDQGASVSAYGYDGPTGLASDGTRLLVSDNNNNRVLIYNHIPTVNNTPADVVIGEQNMFDDSYATTATIIIPYDPTLLNRINPLNLRIAYYDTNINKWKLLQNNTVFDIVNHTLSNTTKQFSYFAVVYLRN